MGIDIVSLEAILLAFTLINKDKKDNKILTLGRQQFHRNTYIINSILYKYKYYELINKYNYNDYC